MLSATVTKMKVTKVTVTKMKLNLPKSLSYAKKSHSFANPLPAAANFTNYNHNSTIMVFHVESWLIMAGSSWLAHHGWLIMAGSSWLAHAGSDS